ncbi:acyltransferase GLAUCE-like [Tasmannia lanceolata]|uniref:acyltransferase GLAUCE-like n=1 Tax=Tasmannia lanceolata TaxID=3420 RepID=UPI004062EC4B
MEELRLVERFMVVPQTPTRHHHLFLSNLDLMLVAYSESVSFFGPPAREVPFSQVYHNLRGALSRLLVVYDFLAGRVGPGSEEGRLEIDCNSKGVVLVAASATCEMSQLGELRRPKPSYKHLVKFLLEEGGEEVQDKPLLLLQLTRFQCGSLALAARSNHCILDGVATRDFLNNLGSFTRGQDLVVVPDSDRMVFKARAPPRITHTHFEYSKLVGSDALFSIRGMSGLALNQPSSDTSHLIYLSPERIIRLKIKACRDGPTQNCTTFDAVAAKIWKAMIISKGLSDEQMSTMLFPVDVRQRVAPHVPPGFAGNALVPGFARGTAGEVKTEELWALAAKVREGVDRLDDEYVRSGIDWLEVHKGVPCRVESFSVVAWLKLDLEEGEYEWGGVKCTTPIVVKPGLVILLPGEKNEGGINICLELPSDQVKEFHKQMMEDD